MAEGTMHIRGDSHIVNTAVSGPIADPAWQKGEHSARKATRMTDRTRMLLMSLRQALIIALGAIEKYLGLDRSIVPRRKR